MQRKGDVEAWRLWLTTVISGTRMMLDACLCEIAIEVA